MNFAVTGISNSSNCSVFGDLIAELKTMFWVVDESWNLLTLVGSKKTQYLPLLLWQSYTQAVLLV